MLMKDHLGMLAEKHWTTYRPKMVAHLRKVGALKDALTWATDQTEKDLISTLRHSAQETAARERAMTNILLPPEREVPILSQDLMPFPQPPISSYVTEKSSEEEI